jgi:hypothetical protein
MRIKGILKEYERRQGHFDCVHPAFLLSTVLFFLLHNRLMRGNGEEDGDGVRGYLKSRIKI